MPPNGFRRIALAQGLLPEAPQPRPAADEGPTGAKPQSTDRPAENGEQRQG
jgi:hypothetical protein